MSIKQRPQEDDPIAKWRQEDGSLYNLSPWVAWHLGEPTICLDGDFDLDELQAIVTTMNGGA